MTKPIHVTRAQAKRLERNLHGVKPAKRHSDQMGEVMTALQSAAGRALDMAGVDAAARQRVLLSPEFNRHCLKMSRELARKLQGEKVTGCL